MEIEFTSSFGYFFQFFMIGLCFHIPSYFVFKSYFSFGPWLDRITK